MKLLPALALAASICIGATCAAADSKPSISLAAAQAFDRDAIVGREKKPHADTLLVTPPLPKAAQQQLLEKMHRMRDMVLATPALRGLRGHDWHTFDSIAEDHRSDFPVVGRVSYIAYPYAQIQGKVQSSAEGPSFVIHINKPEVVLGIGGYNLDREAGFTTAPPIVGELDGFPVYQEQFVVLTKDRRPLFVPVSEGQYLEALVRKARQALAEKRKRFADVPEQPDANQREIDGRMSAIRAARAENESRWAVMQSKWPDRVAAERARFDEKERKLLTEVEELKTTTPRERYLKPFVERLAAMEAELASLPEAQKAAPARLAEGKPERASGLADVGAASGRVVSTLNPNIFDPAKPKHSIQLIILGSTRYMPEVYSQVQRQLDTAALVALID